MKSSNHELMKGSRLTEITVTTSSSSTINARVALLQIEGAGSISQTAWVRAATFVPKKPTTIQFYATRSHKKPSCVHVVPQMCSTAETKAVLDDAQRTGSIIGWWVVVKLRVLATLQFAVSERRALRPPHTAAPLPSRCFTSRQI